MVDDVAIKQSRLVHIVQRLLYRVRSLGTVGTHRQRIVGLDKGQVVVDVGELFAGNFVGHEIGIYLLGPHVIKPTHGHQVTKPHVGRLVGNEVESRHLLIGSGLGAEEDALIIELDAAWVLHTTKLVTRQDDKTIVLKWVRNSCIFLHPLQG